MRVRICVHRFRPDVGGTELMAEAMASHLAANGDRVEVVTLRGPGVPPEEMIPAPTSASDGTSARQYRVRRLEVVRGPVRLPVGYWRVLSEPTDVTHVFGNRIWDSDFFLPVARWVPGSTVLTGQNFYQLHMHPNAINRFYAERYFPRAAGQVDAYVVQTIEESEQFRRFGFRGRIELIPHATDPREFSGGAAAGPEFREAHGLTGERVLLSCGGFAPNKRMDRVISGVAKARSRWRLVITGADWPGHAADLESCRDLARRLGVAPIFLGDGRPVPRAEVIAAFLACDAYGQGSSYEGYGGAIQEAMVAERPFVAFSTGAVPEFVLAGAGFGVRTDTDFAAALDELAGSDGLGPRMGRAGREEVLAHRSTDVAMGRYERLFRELHEANPRKAPG